MVEELKKLTNDELEKAQNVFKAFNLLGLTDQDIDKIAFIVKTYDNLVAKVNELDIEMTNQKNSQNMNNLNGYEGLFNGK